ncbi:MAG: hypothetical protein ACTSU2_09675 [Promethearchaeota archaeon]
MEQIPETEYYTLTFDDEYELNDQVISYRITNIVCLGILDLNEDYEIEFDKIRSVIETRDLNRFPGCLIKISNISVIIFKNGKIIITGIKNHKQIKEIKTKLEIVLNKAAIEYNSLKIEIQNYVSMVNLQKNINLETASISLDNCIYEPEQFPAAIVRDLETGIAFLIFSNSKIICLGARELDKMEKSLKSLVSQLFELELVF